MMSDGINDNGGDGGAASSSLLSTDENDTDSEAYLEITSLNQMQEETILKQTRMLIMLGRNVLGYNYDELIDNIAKINKTRKCSLSAVNNYFAIKLGDEVLSELQEEEAQMAALQDAEASSDTDSATRELFRSSSSSKKRHRDEYDEEGNGKRAKHSDDVLAVLADQTQQRIAVKQRAAEAKRMRAKEQREQEMHKLRGIAALIIQGHHRQRAKRKRVEQERLARQERLVNAAIILQKHCRRRLSTVTVANRRTELLNEECSKIEKLSFADHDIHVVNLRLMEAVVRKIEEAFDPVKPNLALIPIIARDLLIILQNIAHYKKAMSKFTSKKEAKSIDTLMGINLSHSLGSIASRIEKNIEAKAKAMNGQSTITVLLSQLKAALHRQKTGEEPSSSCVTANDMKYMKLSFLFDQAAENVVVNCLHLAILVRVEEYLSVAELFELCGERGLQRATELWNAVRSNEPFNAEDTTMLEYRETVLLPAFERVELRSVAVDVAMDFANNLTDIRTSGRKEIVLPAIDQALKKSFDGSDAAETDADADDSVEYCAGAGGVQNARRGRMTCLFFNLSASAPIQQHLPNDLFRGGYKHDLLVNSQTFCKRSCNFVNPSERPKPGFFKDGHDMAKTVKGIRDNIIHPKVGTKNVIIDSEEQLASLKRLFL